MDSQRIRILVSKDYRAHNIMMLEIEEPQQADLNIDANKLAVCHAQFSFGMWMQISPYSMVQ